MDSELLQSLFCCMFPLKIRRRKRVFRPTISSPLKKSRQRKISVGSGCDRFQKLLFLQRSPLFVDQKKEILHSIPYDGSRTLVVWCPPHVVPNDYIITLFHQYGTIDNFIDNFTNDEPNSELSMWYGSIVEYSERGEALEAFKDAPMKCSHIKVLPLALILQILADCELMCCGVQGSESTVIVSARRSMNSQKTLYLYMELSEYGNIVQLLFDHRPTTPGVVCKVTYSYFTHAYLAMMMLRGQNYEDVALFADIEEEERGDIIKEAKSYLRIVLDAYY